MSTPGISSLAAAVTSTSRSSIGRNAVTRANSAMRTARRWFCNVIRQSSPVRGLR